MEKMSNTPSLDSNESADESYALVIRQRKQMTELMNIPAELRVLIYEWLLRLEGMETVIPGKYSSDVWNPQSKRYLHPPRIKRVTPPWRAGIVHTADDRDPIFLFHENQSRIRPIDAQRLPILSVSRQVRNELAPLLFGKRLAFPRLFDTATRIPAFLIHLPPVFQGCIRKVSIDIRIRADFDKTYGNFIIPYLPLCQNLEAIELRFSLKFYELFFDEKRKGLFKYYLFKSLVKLLVCLLNLPFKDLKITIGDAYSRGDGLIGKDGGSNDNETEAEIEEAIDSALPANVPPELRQKKAQFDKMYANMFVQAANLRDHILALPTASTKRQLIQRQPVYQFYETSMEEKMAQMVMDIETNLHFDDIFSRGWRETVKLSVNEMLQQKTQSFYQEWLLQKYNIPRNTVELRLAQHEAAWKAVGYEDQMLLGLRPEV